MPIWIEVASQVNPVTYGVDAIHQAFLGSGPAGASLGVTVLSAESGALGNVQQAPSAATACAAGQRRRRDLP